ncbi:hypothetical protein HOE31_04290 [bacterium]|jgi:hypothetical protein|nr:hypothetical protein [bacterium]MBT4122139.1 hypothetical protein [bacterium]MBT4335489.1 hypothetical protein [bacterium]MBT4495484.1 hypothetical protein [bacterium]MBT4764331.1 hypothetical protein [bacterium]
MYQGTNRIIKPSYRNLIIVFVILAVILVGAILYFSLSQATITITPNYERQQVGFAIQIVNADIEANQDQQIPGFVKEVIIEDTKTFEAKQITTTESKASGKLTVYNDYSQSQPLIARTRFQSANGQIFRLPSGVTIPANGTLEITVIAEEEGQEYEVSAGDFILPALSEWRKQYVYAKSQEQMKRGQVTNNIINQDTIDQAVIVLTNELKTKALEQINSEITGNQSIIEEFLTTDVFKYSASIELPSNEDSFDISLGLVVKALVTDLELLKEKAILSLPSMYVNEGAITKIDPNSFTYEITLLDENSENLVAQVKGEYILEAAHVEIDKSQLKGLSTEEAKTYLENLSDVNSVEIHIPFWSKLMPSLKDHINIEIVE